MKRLPITLAAILAAFSFCAPSGAQVIGERKVKKIQVQWAPPLLTKNYEILHESAIPASTVGRIGQELEEILEQYVRLFGIKPKERFKVKFLDSTNTYEQEGGDLSHPGYYNPGSRNLVLKQMPFYDLIPTCYHEAFHQYIHMYVGYDRRGDVIPIWFNEGMAMYYEGMERDPGGGNNRRPLNPRKIKMRKLRMVKSAVFTRSSIPLEKLIDADYKQFHDKDNEQLHYNQSFALVYFFMEKSSFRAPLAFAKALRQTKDDAKAVEVANAKLFGKQRKNLKKVEAMWKSYMSQVKIPEDKS